MHLRTDRHPCYGPSGQSLISHGPCSTCRLVPLIQIGSSRYRTATLRWRCASICHMSCTGSSERYGGTVCRQSSVDSSKTFFVRRGGEGSCSDGHAMFRSLWVTDCCFSLSRVSLSKASILLWIDSPGAADGLQGEQICRATDRRCSHGGLAPCSTHHRLVYRLRYFAATSTLS